MFPLLLIVDRVPNNWFVPISNVPPVVVVRVPFTVMLPPVVLEPLVLFSLRLPYVPAERTWFPIRLVYSTVKFVSVLLVMVYCDKKSAVAAVLVTCTVPAPVSVPAPEMNTAATGIKMPSTINVLPAATGRSLFSVSEAPLLTFQSMLVFVNPPED